MTTSRRQCADKVVGCARSVLGVHFKAMAVVDELWAGNQGCGLCLGMFVMCRCDNRGMAAHWNVQVLTRWWCATEREFQSDGDDRGHVTYGKLDAVLLHEPVFTSS
jgi:hypothetical protein